MDLQIKVVKENLNNILFDLVEPSWLKDDPTDPADSSMYVWKLLFTKLKWLKMYKM